MKLSQYSKGFILLFALSVGFSLTCFGAGDGNLSLTKVCIDPGHGGKDAGAVSKDGKTKEKDIVLDISLRLASLIEASGMGVNVTMTRKTDEFIPLKDRADKARKAGAQLFISVHVNADPKGKASGYSTYVLSHTNSKGADILAANMDLCKRENDVIMLEDNYQATYKSYDSSDPASNILASLEQSANLEQSISFGSFINGEMKKNPLGTYSNGVSQGNFYVLRNNTKIAVLLELGFISSATDLAVIRTEDGRDKIARNIYNAFVKFKKSYDESMSVPSADSGVAAQPESKGARPESKDARPEGKDEAAQIRNAGEILYGTQILATARKMQKGDKFFKGYEFVEVPAGRMYKYVVGVSADSKTARAKHAEIKKVFADSFLVKIDGENVTRVK